MSTARKLLVAFAAFSILPSLAAAAPEPEQAERRTKWGLYLDSVEAHALKTGPNGAKVFLVDVRDPIEIMFTGFAPAVDEVVPFMRADKSKWNAKKNVYAMEADPAFAEKLEAAFLERGLKKADDPVVIMCRSGGERGAPAAKQLEKFGFAKVYVVTDGFEGDTSTDGPKKPARIVNGWRNSGLPWGFALDESKFPKD